MFTAQYEKTLQRICYTNKRIAAQLKDGTG